MRQIRRRCVPGLPRRGPIRRKPHGGCHYRDQYNHFVTFTGDWDRFRELQADVESDASLMQQFRDEAEAQIRELAERERQTAD